MSQGDLALLLRLNKSWHDGGFPLLNAFENDLLWAQSRAGQELFHSNTIAWLLGLVRAVRS
jgi:hypothetical protein